MSVMELIVHAVTCVSYRIRLWKTFLTGGGGTLSDRGKTLLLAGKIEQQSCNRSKILHSAGVMIIAWELLEFLKTEIKGV